MVTTMTEQELKKLNQKILEFAGFTWTRLPVVTSEKGSVYWAWIRPDGAEIHKHDDVPDFTDPEWGIAHLFKWVVPKVSNYNMCKGLEPGKPVFGQHIVEVWSLTKGYGKAYSKEPALALCYAVEKLIDIDKEE